MMSRQGPRRAGLIWAVVGGVVLLGGVAALIANTALGSPAPSSTATRGGEPTPRATSSPSPFEPVDSVVDPAATELGWVPEPVTGDAEAYVRAALSAATTLNTTLATRDDWVVYLDTWFTPDTRYSSESDRADELEAAQVELRQGVVFPQEMWDQLAAQSGRVAGSVPGEVAWGVVPEDASGDMRIGTADVVMVFTQADGSGAESSYTEQVRASVQVLCGPGSVPAPDSPQQAGDCKVVRYFTEPVED